MRGLSHEQRKQVSPEVCRPAVCISHEVQDRHASRWKAIAQIVPKIGCSGAMLLNWIKRAEIGNGQHPGVTIKGLERIRTLEREVKELRRGNEILKTASAFLRRQNSIAN